MRKFSVLMEIILDYVCTTSVMDYLKEHPIKDKYTMLVFVQKNNPSASISVKLDDGILQSIFLEQIDREWHEYNGMKRTRINKYSFFL